MTTKRRVWKPKDSTKPNQIWAWIKKAFAWGLVGCLLGLLTVLTVSYIEACKGSTLNRTR